MSLEDNVRIQHMLDAPREVVSFGQGQTYDSLESDHMRALAIIWLLEIIGEAAATISPQFQSTAPHIPWRVMAATQNRLIHAYFSVNLRIILDTVPTDLPPLIADLESLIH